MFESANAVKYSVINLIHMIICTYINYCKGSFFSSFSSFSLKGQTTSALSKLLSLQPTEAVLLTYDGENIIKYIIIVTSVSYFTALYRPCLFFRFKCTIVTTMFS